ncbi:MAG: nucleotide exchange factor GrpE [Candidatus Omnitrophica bacterium]|nr:nucleotide exchange factor GrpE [Candidatus Omnitrophota bacterium]
MSEEKDISIDPPPEGAETLEKLQQELGEAKDKYIRLFAEFDNMRKRNQREREELIKYAHEEVIIELLSFFEDFERTLAAAKTNPLEGASLVKGVEMVMKRMQDLLRNYDVKEIEALGKKFDHNQHEALMVVESNDHEDETVIEVFSKGYLLGNRVAKPAKVKVARKPSESLEVSEESKDLKEK